MTELTDDDRIVLRAIYYLLDFLWCSELKEAANVHRQVTRLLKLLGGNFRWENIADKLEYAATEVKHGSKTHAIAWLNAIDRELGHAIIHARKRPTYNFGDCEGTQNK